ncbi:MAG: hypothetical protein IJC88_06325 [Oscillospiraceae bacterium]|nr:hypothetical protein [Oscillospiraceae bacterium]
MEQEKKAPKKRSKRFLVGYSIALFLFASVLILFSYLSQARVSREADLVRQELTKKTEVAAGFESRLQQVTETNEALTEKNEALTANNASLQSKVDSLNTELASAKKALSTTTYAYEILWKLICADHDKDKEACKSYLKQASELDMETLLSETGFAEYKRIKSKFKGE